MGCGSSKENKNQAAVAPEPKPQKQEKTPAASDKPQSSPSPAAVPAPVTATSEKPKSSAATVAPPVAAAVTQPKPPAGCVLNCKYYDIPRKDRPVFKELFEKSLTVRRTEDLPQDKIDKLFSGDFDINVSIPSQMLRLFTSSTFTDTKEERDHLMDVYPYLRDLCDNMGMTFQVVDMRWGIREQAGADHQTSAICMNQVHLCLDLSTGPAFFTMLGNKYGYRPFPATINTKLFTKLRNWIVQEGKYAEEVTLLDKWFVLEQNAVPQVYKLHTITRLIPDFNHPSDKAKAKAAGNEWWGVFEKMQAVLRHAAIATCDEHEREPFVISVTEEEIYNGILNNPNAAKQCYCFRRDFTGMPETFENTRAAGSFIDMANGKVDKEAVDLLHKLKYEKIPAKLPASRIYDFKIGWVDATPGVRPDTIPEHAEHVKKFVNTFCEIAAKDVIESYKPRLSDEVKDLLEQHEIIDRSLDSFSGRKVVLSAIDKYLATDLDAERAPMFIIGESGSGKSAVMAKAHSLARKAHPKAVVVVRFCGSTTESSSLRLLLYSCCRQIRYAYFKKMSYWGEEEEAEYEEEEYDDDDAGEECEQEVGEQEGAEEGEEEECEQEEGEEEEGEDQENEGCDDQDGDDGEGDYDDEEEEADNFNPEGPLPEDDEDLIEHFRNLLSCATLDMPLIIMIDSPTLADTDPLLRWIPSELPHNCYMIVSMCPGKACDLKKKVNEATAFTTIPALAVDAQSEFIRNYESRLKRTLTASQRTILQNAINSCPLPLYAKMACLRALKWRSYTKDDDCVLAPDINGLINAIFNDLEEEFGVELTSTSLSLIVCSQQGLSDVEMVDLISLDDDVLNDVYQWWVPPVRRLPPLLWTRIQTTLSTYMVRCGEDQLNRFLHESFVTAINSRYLSKPEKKSKIYRLLAEYFAGVWYNKPKPYTAKDGKSADADRAVPDMPNSWGGDDDSVIYNLRKIEELVPAVLHLGDASLLPRSLLDVDYVRCAVDYGYSQDLLAQYKTSLSVAWSNWPVNVTLDVVKTVEAFFRSKSGIIETYSSALTQLLLETPDKSYLHEAIVKYLKENNETDLFLWHDITERNDVVAEPVMSLGNIECASPFVKFSGDRNFLCVSTDSGMDMRSTETGATEWNFDLDGSARDVCFSDDDQLIYSVVNNELHRMERVQGNSECVIAAGEDMSSCDAFKNVIAVGVGYSQVTVYDTSKEYAELFTISLDVGSKPVTSLSYSKDGKKLLVCCESASFVYQMPDKGNKSILVAWMPSVYRAVWSSDCNRIAAISKSHVTLYDVNNVIDADKDDKQKNAKSKRLFKKIDQAALPAGMDGVDVAFVDDKLVSAAADHVIVYSMNDNKLKELARALAHGDVIKALGVCGKTFITSGADLAVKYWTCDTVIKTAATLLNSKDRAPMTAISSMVRLSTGVYYGVGANGQLLKYSDKGDYLGVVLGDDSTKILNISLSSDGSTLLMCRKVTTKKVPQQKPKGKSPAKHIESSTKPVIDVVLFDVVKNTVIATISTGSPAVYLGWHSNFGCESAPESDVPEVGDDGVPFSIQPMRDACYIGVVIYEDGMMTAVNKTGKVLGSVSKKSKFSVVALSANGVKFAGVTTSTVTGDDGKKHKQSDLCIYDVVKSTNNGYDLVESWKITDDGSAAGLSLLAFSPDSAFLGTAGVGAYFYNIEYQSLIESMNNDTVSNVRAISFCPDGRYASYATSDMIWTIDSESCTVTNYYPTTSPLSCLMMHSDKYANHDIFSYVVGACSVVISTEIFKFLINM